jgi:DNA-binding transcriptional LysR family regulator
MKPARDPIDLNEINVFYRVLREGSFTKAALALHLPKSTVSERVSRLEERLGVRLLERSTRTLRATEAGTAYFEHASRIVAEAEEADAAVADLAHSPRGTIRMFSPLVVARSFLNAVVCEFMARHPRVEFELVAADRRVDLLEEGFDLGVHVVGPLDPSYVVRSLDTTNRLYVASAEYLARRGTPRSPEDLREHDLIVGNLERRARWRFERDGQVVEHDLFARYGVTSIELAVDAAVRGLGILAAPSILAGELLRETKLTHVLEEYTAQAGHLSLIFPSSRHISYRVRLLIDLIVERFAEVPKWQLRGERDPNAVRKAPSKPRAR